MELTAALEVESKKREREKLLQTLREVPCVRACRVPCVRVVRVRLGQVARAFC